MSTGVLSKETMFARAMPGYQHNSMVWRLVAVVLMTTGFWMLRGTVQAVCMIVLCKTNWQVARLPLLCRLAARSTVTFALLMAVLVTLTMNVAMWFRFVCLVRSNLLCEGFGCGSAW